MLKYQSISYHKRNENVGYYFGVISQHSVPWTEYLLLTSSWISSPEMSSDQYRDRYIS